MSAEPRVVSGSFRDPLSAVFDDGDRIVRGFTELGSKDLDVALPFIAELYDAGLHVATGECADPPPGYVRALEHPRLPLITYPFEWSFTMLKDAALLQLDVVARGLERGIAVKDATPFNVQFVGARPIFIDAGSFEPRNESDPWFGYQQFCEMFLFPLMLKAHVGADFQPYLRGSINGIPLAQARRLLGGLRPTLQRGRLTHVVLHEFAQRTFRSEDASTVEQARSAGMSTEVVAATVTKLHALVSGLEHPDGSSTWSDYSDRAHYVDDSLAQKQAFVADVLGRRPRWGEVWDFGCNDGLFSEQAATVADLVVAIDADELVVDRLYRRLSSGGASNIVPLLGDLSQIGGGVGWRGEERPGLFERASIDLGLYLAVVHHMAITFNIPIPKQVDLLGDHVEELVIEFPHRDDPMVETLLRNKREGLYADYDRPQFEAALERRFEITAREESATGTRTLYAASARR